MYRKVTNRFTDYYILNVTKTSSFFGSLHHKPCLILTYYIKFKSEQSFNDIHKKEAHFGVLSAIYYIIIIKSVHSFSWLYTISKSVCVSKHGNN